MPRIYFHVMLAVGLALTAGAAPADRMKAARAEFEAAEAAFYQAREKLADPHQDDPEVDRLAEALAAKQRAAFAEALQVAQADPQSDAGFDALEWLLLRAPAFYSQPAGVPALELMAKHYAADPRVGRAVARVAHFAPYGLPHGELEAVPAYRPAVDLLRAVAERNPDRAVRGQAVMGLAWQAKHAATYAAYKRSPDADRYKAEAEQALEAVDRDYGDCLYIGTYKGRPAKSTLGKLARSELFELRSLQPGKVAPDIEGEDLDGAKFKLSDCRGKVVLLVFWGAWCGPCMAAVPHERELVARFKGRPFAVVGVNSDEEKAKALRAVAKHQIPWRSFWNGPEGPRGAIADAWNVRSWPTVYVIDHHGVIRETTLDGEELDGPLEKLVAEAEVATGRGR